MEWRRYLGWKKYVQAQTFRVCETLKVFGGKLSRASSKKAETMQIIVKDIPVFANEDEERAFWRDHDSTEYIDWDAAESVVLPKLKPSNIRHVVQIVPVDVRLGHITPDVN